jgi:TRAP-type transport system periplasmic protein
LKKGLIFLLSILVILLLLTSACAPSETPKDNSNVNAADKPLSMNPIELKLAHFFPATHPAETELVQGWKDAVEEATDGLVIITSYPGQTLLAAPEIYDGVVTGIAELGLSCFSYTRGRFPLLEAFELPGVVYNNSSSASKVAWDGIKELNPKEVQDTRLMMVLATGPGDLFTRVPVRSLDDLQGLEIRATGLSAKTLEVLGAIPVAMPQSDAYEALSRGVVQGNLSPIEVLQGWRHAEVTDYLTLTPFLYNTLFFVTMNLDTWNSLPPEIQTAINEATEKFYDDVVIGLWDRQNESAIKFAVDETGQEIIKLSDEETARWMNIVISIQDEFVSEMEGKGLPGKDAVNLVKRLSDHYNEIYK